jgi:hypothetical protein
MATRRRLVLVLAALLGCGPPKLAADDGGTTTSQSSTIAGSESSTSESESSGSESESSSESTDATTFEFVPEFDIVGDGDCDSYAQDCPEGEKCVPYSSTGGIWDANKCVPVLGEQEPGEPCHYSDTVSSTDDCDATSFCWDVMDVDGEWIGTCASFCTGTADDPQCPDAPGCADASCLINGDSSINLCLPSCDPLAQDCNPGLACYWAGNDFNCIFFTQNLPIGEVCGFINDCVGGAVCTASELLPNCAGENCCTPFCDTAALVDPCPELLEGTSCQVFLDSPEEGCAVGSCLAPP